MGRGNNFIVEISGPEPGHILNMVIACCSTPSYRGRPPGDESYSIEHIEVCEKKDVLGKPHAN